MSDQYSLQKISLIEDDYGNIIQWAVWKEEDVHKNYIEYEYDNFKVQGLSGDNTNLNRGQYFHIKKITYTKSKGQNLKYYTVEFEKESRVSRQDISIYGKRGVKEVEPYRLSNIFVKYDNKLIRTYTFSYKEGQYFKTLLSRITHTDPSGDVAMQVTNSTGGHGGLRHCILHYGFTDPLHIVFRIPSSFICTIIKSIIICIPEYATEAAIMCCNCVGEIILNSMNEYKHPRFQTQELKVN